LAGAARLTGVGMDDPRVDAGDTLDPGLAAQLRWLVELVQQAEGVHLGHPVRLIRLADPEALDDRLEQAMTAAPHGRESARAQRGAIVSVEGGMLEHRSGHHVHRVEDGASLARDQGECSQRLVALHEDETGSVTPGREPEVADGGRADLRADVRGESRVATTL